jgi:diguanylate cyclase (GGDEF)-like protein
MQLVVRDARDCQQGELPEPIQSGLTTELPNRSQFCDRLKGAIARANRNQQRVGVLLLGMDHFKLVNTTLGHRAGDLVLNRVAERLAQCVRLVDTAARVGGDEFSLVLEGITDRQQAATVAQRTLKLLSQPMQIGDQEVQLSASIGIAVHPLDTDDPDTLLQKADAAMYYAKENARGSYQFYSPDVDAQPSDHQLRRADIKARFERLTAREREVLELVVDGKTNKMIANLLGASSRTIENHRAKIMEKMQAGSLPQLVQMVFDLRAR